VVISYLTKSNQDDRYRENLSEIVPFVKTIFYASISSLMECSCLSEFYSKDLITEFSYISKIGISFVFMILISLILICFACIIIYFLKRVRFTFVDRFIRED